MEEREAQERQVLGTDTNRTSTGPWISKHLANVDSISKPLTMISIIHLLSVGEEIQGGEATSPGQCSPGAPAPTPDCPRILTRAQLEEESGETKLGFSAFPPPTPSCTQTQN